MADRRVEGTGQQRCDHTDAGGDRLDRPGQPPATRKAISDAATELFLERGFDAVTIREIAEKADVSPTTVLTHFPQKGALVFDEDEEQREPEDEVRAFERFVLQLATLTGTSSDRLRMLDAGFELREHGWSGYETEHPRTDR